MELTSSIVDMAKAMSGTKIQQGIGVRLLEKTMDLTAQTAAATIDMIDDVSPARAFAGDIGAIFDARA